MKDELKNAYYGPQVLIVIGLFGLSCWGAIDSFYDPDGQRLLGALPFLTPAILAGWRMLTILWKQINTAEKLVIHFFFHSFIVALPFIIANILFVIGAWMVPVNKIGRASCRGKSGDRGGRRVSDDKGSEESEGDDKITTTGERIAPVPQIA